MKTFERWWNARGRHNRQSRDALALEAWNASTDAAGWRCYWCNCVFVDRDQATRHFGPPHCGQEHPACVIETVTKLRTALERVVRDLIPADGYPNSLAVPDCLVNAAKVLCWCDGDKGGKR